MFELKTLSQDAIPHALERVERYRLLNEPRVAVSICQDILKVDSGNQEAIIGMVLAITDQFGQSSGARINQALELIPQLENEYDRDYYTGIIYEREAKARLNRRYPGVEYDAYDMLRDAMDWFEKADDLRPVGNEDVRLRWNACARIVMDQNLTSRPRTELEQPLE
jgi:hypothetical protein